MQLNKISEVHEHSLELLSQLDIICKKNNIRYYLIYGILIGYMRNADLIPWDDDIDIVMLRDDYERFIELPSEEFPPGCKMVLPKKEKEFFDFIPRVMDTNYYCRRKDIVSITGEPIEEYIGIDIFVLDRAEKGIKMRYRLMKMKLTYLQATKFRHFKTKHSHLIGLLKRLAGLTACRKTLSELVEKYENLSKSCNKDTKMLFISNVPPNYLTDIFEESHFHEPQTIILRGREYPAPTEIDKLLRVTYSDYTVLPPKEERTTQHFLVELDESSSMER